MGTQDDKNVIRDFVAARQWAQDNIKHPEPQDLKCRLNGLTRRFSTATYSVEDIEEASLYIEHVKEFRDIQDGKVGVVGSFNNQSFGEDNESKALQSDGSSDEESSPGSGQGVGHSDEAGTDPTKPSRFEIGNLH